MMKLQLQLHPNVLSKSNRRGHSLTKVCDRFQKAISVFDIGNCVKKAGSLHKQMRLLEAAICGGFSLSYSFEECIKLFLQVYNLFKKLDQPQNDANFLSLIVKWIANPAKKTPFSIYLVNKNVHKRSTSIVQRMSFKN